MNQNAFADVPTFTLNNGVEMPMVGLGVYQSSVEQTSEAVRAALANGYRLIDTAAVYKNEKQVGEGIRQSGLDRSEVFVTTKLWISDFGYDKALRAFDASMELLGLDYLDLYLIHWPTPSNFAGTLAAYRAIEKLLAEKRVRAIGVSNFNPKHLEDLLAQAEVVPTVNQVELHPFFSQRAVREADDAHGIVTQAWSPIGGVYVYEPADVNAVRNLLEQPTIVGLAHRHAKTPAQVLLRWHLQHGFSVIPKSVRPERMAENIDVFDFELSDDDMADVDGLESGVRGGPDPEVFDLEFLASRA